MNGAVLHPAALAVAAGVLPMLSVAVAYALSIGEHLVPACMPFIDGCTSISRAARHGWANHWFRATMLPSAALIAGFWWLAAAWLQAMQVQAPRRRRAMLLLGLIGALFLVLYATFLGVEGKTYQWLRRYGVTVFFSFTALAQLLLASAIGGHATSLRRQLGAVGAAMLLLGLASIPLQVLERDAAINAIEWWFALLMTGVFPLVGIGWHRQAYRLRASVTDP